MKRLSLTHVAAKVFVCIVVVVTFFFSFFDFSVNVYRSMLVRLAFRLEMHAGSCIVSNMVFIQTVFWLEEKQPMTMSLTTPSLVKQVLANTCQERCTLIWNQVLLVSLKNIKVLRRGWNKLIMNTNEQFVFSVTFYYCFCCCCCCCCCRCQ